MAFCAAVRLFIHLFPYSVQTDLLTAHYTSCQLEPLLYTSLPTEVAIPINSSTLKVIAPPGEAAPEEEEQRPACYSPVH